MNSIASIFISRMSVLHTEKSVTNVMFELRIGTVSRVDFVPINKKPGFVENFDDVYKSAFVHFYLPTEDAPKNKHSHVYPRNKYIWDMIVAGEPCRIHVTPTEYWFIFCNHRPVPQTMMNIHQVVENGRYLEKLVEKQSQKLEEQDAIIKRLEAKLDGVHQSVYQLIGGLFNQGNQRDILEEHINCLFPDAKNEYTEDALPEKNKWTIYPTTRQGDECESRIEALEQQIQDMLKFDFNERTQHYEDHYDEAELLHRCNINYIYNDRDSLSSYSSIPDLIDVGDDSSSHSSMPDLIDASSDNSGERIRNSIELCGNE